jgi:CheY-like chemotaxis protein
LLVENNAKDRDLFLEAIRETELAHDLVMARDGEEALALLFPPSLSSAAPLRPAVIILDLKLPTLGGVGVLRHIKSTPMTQSIPVVVFSSSQDRRHLADCYQAGANAYVVKPVRFSELLKALRVLGRFWTGLNHIPPDQKIHLLSP